MGIYGGPSVKTYSWGGETHTAPADSPADLSLLLFMDFYWRESNPHRMSEFSHSSPFHHCIDSFKTDTTALQTPTSLHLCRMFTAKHVCLFLDS